MIDLLLEMLIAIMLPLSWIAFQLLIVILLLVSIMAIVWRTLLPKES